MDYEKEYKKLKADISKAYLYAQTDSTKAVLESILPELKESEDEQHRKWILEYLYDGLRKSDEQFKDQFKSAIAWLKKQSEEVRNIALRTEYEKGRADAITEMQTRAWSEENEEIPFMLNQEEINWLKSTKQRIGE